METITFTGTALAQSAGRLLLEEEGERVGLDDDEKEEDVFEMEGERGEGGED